MQNKFEKKISAVSIIEKIDLEMNNHLAGK